MYFIFVLRGSGTENITKHFCNSWIKKLILLLSEYQTINKRSKEVAFFWTFIDQNKNSVLCLSVATNFIHKCTDPLLWLNWWKQNFIVFIDVLSCPELGWEVLLHPVYVSYVTMSHPVLAMCNVFTSLISIQYQLTVSHYIWLDYFSKFEHPQMTKINILNVESR